MGRRIFSVASVLGVLSLLVGVVVPYLVDDRVAARETETAKVAADAEQDEAAREEAFYKDLVDSIGDVATGNNPIPEIGTPSDGSSKCSTSEGFAGGWGPERPIFRDTDRPQYALFNSVRDYPFIGDERAFAGIRDNASPDALWKSSIDVERDHTYVVRVFVRNDSEVEQSSASDTRVSFNLPTCTGTSIQAAAFVSSDDSFPLQVYSLVAFGSDERFNLDYVEGSAVIENNSSDSPFVLEDAQFLASPGQLIGFDTLDGNLKPGNEHAVYFSFEVRPQFAS